MAPYAKNNQQRWLPGRNSVPPSFVSFFVFYIFSYLLSKSWVAFLGAQCHLPAFRSCFVEFTRRLNALLMNLWGRKCSPRPTPPPSSINKLFSLMYLEFFIFVFVFPCLTSHIQKCIAQTMNSLLPNLD